MQIGLYTFADVSRDPRTGVGLAPEVRLRHLIEETELADQVGLDVFGIGEHHRPDFSVSSPAVVLAAAAVRTTRIRLTSAVTVISSDDPVRVFQQFATVDLLSGGRADIMAGRGSFIESYPLFGQDLRDYDALFAEKLDLLMRLRETERITWSGVHRPSIDDRGVYPRPVQDRLPIWVAVGGTPASAVHAGTLGLPMALAIIGGVPDRFAPFAQLYRTAGARAGHDPSRLPLRDRERAREPCNCFTSFQASRESSALAADGYPGAARVVDRRHRIGQRLQVRQELVDPPAGASPRHVVRREAAAREQLGPHRDQVVLVPVLVRVGKHEVERPGEGRHYLVCVSKAGIDVRCESRLLEVRDRSPVPVRIEFNRGQLAAGLRECPGDPDPGVPGRGSDFESPRELVLHDQVVQDPPVTLRHVEVAPRPPTALQKRLHRLVELRIDTLACDAGDEVGRQQQHGGGTVHEFLHRSDPFPSLRDELRHRVHSGLLRLQVFVEEVDHRLPRRRIRRGVRDGAAVGAGRADGRSLTDGVVGQEAVPRAVARLGETDEGRVLSAMYNCSPWL